MSSVLILACACLVVLLGMVVVVHVVIAELRTHVKALIVATQALHEEHAKHREAVVGHAHTLTGHAEGLNAVVGRIESAATFPHGRIV